jgi:hypothetical protein
LLELGLGLAGCIGIRGAARLGSDEALEEFRKRGLVGVAQRQQAANQIALAESRAGFSSV